MTWQYGAHRAARSERGRVRSARRTRTQNQRHTWIFALLLPCFALIAAMVVASSAMPVERHISISVQPWPSGHVKRVVLLSDLHVSTPGNSPERLTQTISRVNATRPDLVVIAGDFISNAMAVRRASLSDATAPLGGLRSRDGVVAVLGNNDAAVRDRLALRLRNLGIIVLENRAIRFGPLAVIGLDDHSTRHLDVSAALSSFRRTGGWPLFLAHSPYSVWALPPGGGLVLAGHTHCGQIKLPIISDFVTPASLRRYDCGVVRDGGRLTIISAGLGVSVLPLRLGAPSDFWVIDIGHP